MVFASPSLLLFITQWFWVLSLELCSHPHYLILGYLQKNSHTHQESLPISPLTTLRCLYFRKIFTWILYAHIIQLFKNQLTELFRNTLSYRSQWNYFILNNSFQKFRAKVWTLFPKSLVFLKFIPQELSVSLTLNSLWQDPICFVKATLKKKNWADRLCLL